MTATNHAMTGAIIGLLVGQPLIAIPAAVASHFVCDAIPHFGFNSRWPERAKLKSKIFQNYLIVEVVACLLIVSCLLFLRPEHWLLASTCAFAAAAPDLLSANRYFTIRHNRSWRPNLYSKFAKNIQWFEQPIGAVVEIAWFIAAIIILIPFLR